MVRFLGFEVPELVSLRTFDPAGTLRAENPRQLVFTVSRFVSIDVRFASVILDRAARADISRASYLL